MRPIDADALITSISEWMPTNQETWTESDIPPIENLVASIMMTIEAQPTVDAVPVIRCKDCKNYGTDGNRLNCNVFCCSVPENGFCSMGERKEE